MMRATTMRVDNGYQSVMRGQQVVHQKGGHITRPGPVCRTTQAASRRRAPLASPPCALPPASCARAARTLPPYCRGLLSQVPRRALAAGVLRCRRRRRCVPSRAHPDVLMAACRVPACVASSTSSRRRFRAVSRAFSNSAARRGSRRQGPRPSRAHRAPTAPSASCCARSPRRPTASRRACRHRRRWLPSVHGR